MSITISQVRLDHRVIEALEAQGFDDEFVLALPVLDETVEVAFRVLASESHTEPPSPPRRPSAQEVAVAVWALAMKMVNGHTEGGAA